MLFRDDRTKSIAPRKPDQKETENTNLAERIASLTLICADVERIILKIFFGILAEVGLERSAMIGKTRRGQMIETSRDLRIHPGRRG
jgi:hypothetical protein